MKSDDFLQAHAKWKYGTKQAKEESPRTWLMAKSGYYFPYKDSDALNPNLGMLCVFFNTTSLVMRAEQEIVRGNRGLIQ